MPPINLLDSDVLRLICDGFATSDMLRFCGVNKKWRRFAFAEPTLWRDTTLDSSADNAMARFRFVLQRRGSAVTDVCALFTVETAVAVMAALDTRNVRGPSLRSLDFQLHFPVTPLPDPPNPPPEHSPRYSEWEEERSRLHDATLTAEWSGLVAWWTQLWDELTLAVRLRKLEQISISLKGKDGKDHLHPILSQYELQGETPTFPQLRHLRLDLGYVDPIAVDHPLLHPTGILSHAEGRDPGSTSFNLFPPLAALNELHLTFKTVRYSDHPVLLVLSQRSVFSRIPKITMRMTPGTEELAEFVRTVLNATDFGPESWSAVITLRRSRPFEQSPFIEASITSPCAIQRTFQLLCGDRQSAPREVVEALAHIYSDDRSTKLEFRGRSALEFCMHATNGVANHIQITWDALTGYEHCPINNVSGAWPNLKQVTILPPHEDGSSLRETSTHTRLDVPHIALIVLFIRLSIVRFARPDAFLVEPGILSLARLAAGQSTTAWAYRVNNRMQHKVVVYFQHPCRVKMGKTLCRGYTRDEWRVYAEEQPLLPFVTLKGDFEMNHDPVRHVGYYGR